MYKKRWAVTAAMRRPSVDSRQPIHCFYKIAKPNIFINGLSVGPSLLSVQECDRRIIELMQWPAVMFKIAEVVITQPGNLDDPYIQLISTYRLRLET